MLARRAPSASRRRPRRRARRSPGGRHVVGDDGQAGGKTRQANGHRFKALLRPRARAAPRCSLRPPAGRWRGSRERSSPVRMRAKPAGSARLTPAAASTAVGELRRMGGRERHHRQPGSANRRATARPTAVCGSARKPVSRVGARAIVAAVSRLVGAPGGEIGPDRGERAPARWRKRRSSRGSSISRADRRAVAAVGLEQQPLEIRRDLNVHRRRAWSRHAAQLVAPGRQRARQNVVDVGGDDQLLDRQSHALGRVAGEDVAEIAGRHGEDDRTRGRAERHRGGEIVDDLGDDPRPVDRIDCRRAPAARGSPGCRTCPSQSPGSRRRCP